MHYPEIHSANLHEEAVRERLKEKEWLYQQDITFSPIDLVALPILLMPFSAFFCA